MASFICEENVVSILYSEEVKKMTREELKAQIEELMRQYADEEIDAATYSEKMMELTTSAQDEIDDD